MILYFLAGLFGAFAGAFFTWLAIEITNLGDALDTSWEGDEDPLPQRAPRRRWLAGQKTHGDGKSTAALEILP